MPTSDVRNVLEVSLTPSANQNVRLTFHSARPDAIVSNISSLIHLMLTNT